MATGNVKQIRKERSPEKPKSLLNICFSSLQITQKLQQYLFGKKSFERHRYRSLEGVLLSFLFICPDRLKIFIPRVMLRFLYFLYNVHTINTYSPTWQWTVMDTYDSWVHQLGQRRLLFIFTERVSNISEEKWIMCVYFSNSFLVFSLLILDSSPRCACVLCNLEFTGSYVDVRREFLLL